jgi:hypothetical protein
VREHAEHEAPGQCQGAEGGDELMLKMAFRASIPGERSEGHPEHRNRDRMKAKWCHIVTE